MLICMKKTENNKNILLLDFVQETNSGDAAMQVGILALVKKYFPEFKINISLCFGANQLPGALSQFPYTVKNKDSNIVGGLYFTQEQFNLGNSASPRGKAKKISMAFIMAIFIIVIAIKPFRFLYKKFSSIEIKKSIEAFEKAHFVIWNGRNFRGNGLFSELYNLFILYFHPFVCIFLGKPIVCVGASFWRFQNPVSTLMTKFVFKKCLFVSVREKYSHDIIKKILGENSSKTKVFYLPDISFYVLKKLTHKIKQKSKTESKIIGLTIVGDRELGREETKMAYIGILGDLVGKIYAERRVKFIVIPQVTFAPERNENIVKNIFKTAKIPFSAFYVKNERLTIEDLLIEYAKLDFLIASRMHSAIFALAVGTPVIALPYDDGSKWGILEDMGLSKKYIINIKNLSNINLIDSFNSAWNNKAGLTKKAKAMSDNFYQNVEKHIEYARKFYDDLH